MRWLVRRGIEAAAWRPSHAALLRDQVLSLRRNERAGYTDRDHLAAAAGWLARAQDATGDGGVSTRYSLRHGWAASYPETTGYIVPTFLALADDLDAGFRERARRAIEFLLGVQLPDGAFPAREVSVNRTEPSVFNTGQILHGLTAWHRATGEERAALAAARAADWMVAQQDADGAWRRHLYLTTTTYTAHASCWLAEAGRHFGRPAWTGAAERHLDWVLAHVDPATGWVDLAGFTPKDHQARRAVTHTLAYTLWGVLTLSQLLGRPDAGAVARSAAARVARRLELSRRLPAMLDRDWKEVRPDYACLTGNAQMALIWLRLFEVDGDPRWLNAALKAIDLVKAAQPMASRNPGIRGGIPGSAPLWGDYLSLSLPNWAAKYYVDALLAKRRALDALGQRPTGTWRLPEEVPRSLPEPAAATPASQPRPLRIVLLTRPGSPRVPRMLAAWRSWGFRPAAVLIEQLSEPTLARRLQERLREDGLAATVRAVLGSRLRPSRAPRPSADAADAADAADIVDIADAAPGGDAESFCRAEGIPVFAIGDLTSPDALAALRALAPDLLVHAGAGILRRGLLAIPRLGVLSAHMGLLPLYRGINVAEWARLEGNPVGCTVHLIDEGIDTGDILLAQEIDPGAARSIAELRRQVDEAQLALLGRVLRFVLETGALPPSRPQTPDEGRQYFRMHQELKDPLDTELATARPSSPRSVSVLPSGR